MPGPAPKASLWASSARSPVKQQQPPAPPSDSDDASEFGCASPVPPPAPCREDAADSSAAASHHYITSLGRAPDRLPADPLIASPLAPLSGSGGKGSALKLPGVPPCFVCPISQKIMSDPVIATDGVTYERATIAAMFEAGRRMSPATGRRLPTLDLHPNDGLREAIAGYLDLRRSVERQWEDLEAKMSDYTGQVNRKLGQGDARINQLKKDIEVLQSGASSARRAAGGAAEAGTAAGPLGVPVLALPKPVVEEEEEDAFSPAAKLSPSPAAAAAFSAGPAPRSARGPGPLSARGPLSASASPPARSNQTPRGTPGSSRSSALPSFFAALTPRFSQLGRSPRGANRL